MNLCHLNCYKMANWFNVHCRHTQKATLRICYVDQSFWIKILTSTWIYSTNACEKGLNVTWHFNIWRCLCTCLLGLADWLAGLALMNAKTNRFQQTQHEIFMSFFYNLKFSLHQKFIAIYSDNWSRVLSAATNSV